GEDDAGVRPLSAALEDEGFDDLGLGLIGSFARHLMVATDTWQEKGFAEVAKNYLTRLAPVVSPVPVSEGLKTAEGRRDLAGNGDLRVRRAAVPGTERHALIDALAEPSWLDRVTGGPKA